MRILELLNTLEIGGLERLVVDLASGLRQLGHQVQVVCLRGRGPLAEPLEGRGIEVLALNKGEGFSFRALGRLTSYLRSLRADVLHSHNPLVHHYAAAAGRLAGVPVIVNTRHGLGNYPLIARTERVFRLSCLMTDRVVAVCEAARDYYIRQTGLGAGKLEVIYNGIPLERFIFIPPHTRGKEFVFGTVGRLVPVKDHRTLLAAFAMVRESCPASRLEILGDGPLRQELEQMCRHLKIDDKVVFHGSHFEVPAFLAGVDAFVLCSKSEGLPLTLLEAMAAGLPVLATRVGGVPELVERAGCGWLCPASSPRELADRMTAMIREESAPAMGQRGRQSAVREYSLGKMVAQYEALFCKLLDEKKRGRQGTSR